MSKISPIQDLSDLPGWIQTVISWVAFSLTKGILCAMASGAGNADPPVFKVATAGDLQSFLPSAHCVAARIIANIPDLTTSGSVRHEVTTA